MLASSRRLLSTFSARFKPQYGALWCGVERLLLSVSVHANAASRVASSMPAWNAGFTSGCVLVFPTCVCC